MEKKESSVDTTRGYTARNSNQPSFLETSLFPKKIYEALPKLLADGSSVFKSDREQDVFLLSSLAVLSGCMPTVRGIYDGTEVQANLFAFIVAPAGSGKGSLTWARIMGVAFHKMKTESSDLARQEYERQAAESRTDKQPFLEQPPPYKTLYIPGNSSAAAFIKALKENGETGIICETEADTLSGALKQDWGDFSDLLRKAFHHESVCYLRKSGERYDIEQPAISVVLAGTPGQVNKLIPNAENGLFSRFLFYCFENEPVWRDVSPESGRPSLNEHFGDLAEEVKRMAVCLEKFEKITFELTTPQWRYFNQECPELLLDAIDDTARDFSSSVYRLGLVIYRLAMVLSVIRHYENKTLSSSIICDDIEFANAMYMAKVLLEHSKLMYETMPRAGRMSHGSDKWSQFLAKLPDSFKRADADKLAKELGISERTVTNYLKRLVKTGQIVNPKHGDYQKA
ncbi:DUF3987 domain-containing protein [Fibrella aquatica]|uniref:DUF3987 domain-containing protein n=1 Tax=Fibrella aquatica TaxID=3242487 RepID=UPI0035214491